MTFSFCLLLTALLTALDAGDLSPEHTIGTIGLEELGPEVTENLSDFDCLPEEYLTVIHA